MENAEESKSRRRNRVVPSTEDDFEKWKTSSNGRIVVPSNADIFTLLPASSNDRGSNIRSVRNSLDASSNQQSQSTPRGGRRSSFELQIPLPVTAKRFDSDASGGKRRSMDGTVSTTPPPMIETVAKLKSMSSFRDSSIPALGRERSFKDTRDRSFKDNSIASLGRVRSFKDNSTASLGRERSFKDNEKIRSGRGDAAPGSRTLSNFVIPIAVTNDEQDQLDHSGFQDRSLETNFWKIVGSNDMRIRVHH